LIQSFVACCDDFSADAFFAVQTFEQKFIFVFAFSSLLCFSFQPKKRKSSPFCVEMTKPDEYYLDINFFQTFFNSIYKTVVYL
jgi:hypothetical protein